MEFHNNQSGYENVALTEDKDDLRSSTEVDESVMGDEKNWHTQEDRHSSGRRRKSTVQRYMARFRRHRWILDTLLLVVNISLSTLLVWNFWVTERAPVAKFQVGGDVNGLGPEFSIKIIKFNADPSFVPSDTSKFLSNETVAVWNTIMPAGSGWGEVTDATFFTTSMTHQLHCVFMMARIYAHLVGNTTASLPSDYHSHYLHCVDYLRQGIMCSGDLAMEPHNPSDADDNGPLDGSWNGHHVCKDYGEIIPYLEKQISQGVRKVLPIDD